MYLPHKLILVYFFLDSSIFEVMSKLKNTALISLFLFLYSLGSKGQTPNKYAFSNKIFNLQFLYNRHIPGGDYAKTFGGYNGIGFGGMLKSKTNWVYSFEGNFLFGNTILAETILDNLVSSGGYISSTSGNPGNYAVNMRGLSFYVEGGRVFGLNKRNMNSGIFVKGGLGFLQHKIGFLLKENNIPQLDDNYSRGYDQLSNGISAKQFIGYNHQSVNRLINFYVGVEFMQAQTFNRRGYNYYNMSYDTNSKFDHSVSFRFGWMIPIYLNTKDENEFQFR